MQNMAKLRFYLHKGSGSFDKQPDEDLEDHLGSTYSSSPQLLDLRQTECNHPKEFPALFMRVLE